MNVCGSPSSSVLYKTPNSQLLFCQPGNGSFIRAFKGLRTYWTKILLDENIIGRKYYWTKILLVEIGKIIGRRRLAKKIHLILHAFCTPTRSRKTNPFLSLYLSTFGTPPKYFDECVLTNLMQL